MYPIRQIPLREDFAPLARLLNEAFGTVAREFGFTPENNPSHNAFITAVRLREQLTPEREFYIFESDNRPVGFVAIERSQSRPGTFYIEKLAVAPESRHKGIGRKLMEFALQRIEESGGKTVSLGVIDSHIRLKSWYEGLGYRSVGCGISTICLSRYAIWNALSESND